MNIKKYFKKIKPLIIVYRLVNKKAIIPIKVFINNKKFFLKLKKIKDIRLELGSRDKKSGWVAIDLAKGSDLALDLTKRLPFKDNTISEIHSEHFFEHLSLEEIKNCLKECYRILKDGAKLSFSVPDFERACHLYCKESSFSEKRFWQLPKPNWCKNKMDELNFLIYANNLHKFMFDRENGIERLKEAGFRNCNIRDFDIKKDNDIRKNQSIYFFGKK